MTGACPSRTYTGESARELWDAGYRQVSRAHGTVSRVDMTDDELRAFFIAQNFGEVTSGIPSLPIEDQRDHYRRVHSRDRIYNVPRGVLSQLRSWR